jgi:hypothetical protein
LVICFRPRVVPVHTAFFGRFAFCVWFKRRFFVCFCAWFESVGSVVYVTFAITLDSACESALACGCWSFFYAFAFFPLFARLHLTTWCDNQHHQHRPPPHTSQTHVRTHHHPLLAGSRLLR